MTLSEILVLGDTGTVLAKKRYRDDVKIQSGQEFMSQIKQHGNKLEPYFVIKGVHFYFIKRHRIYFVAISAQKADPVYRIELISRAYLDRMADPEIFWYCGTLVKASLYELCRDMFGVVSEESLRKNFVLLHEILDEFIDFGYVQLTSTDKMKPYIQSNPVLTKTPENKSTGLFGVEHRMVGSQASNKPVIKSKTDQEERQHNEIFIDVVERIAATVDTKGIPIHCEVQGNIDMKCFLIGAPQVKIGFNEGVTLDKQDIKGFGEQIFIDDFKFHSSVKTDALKSENMISVNPPEGMFPLMTYRINKDLVHGLPFRLSSYVNKAACSKDVEVGLKLRCEIPSNCKAVKIVLQVPVPKLVTSVSQQLGGPEQSAEFKVKDSLIVWRVNKMEGKGEESSHFILIGGNTNSDTCELELGPVVMDFEISGFLCSNLQVKSVKVLDANQYSTPKRWVRYITTPDSYMVKLH